MDTVQDPDSSIAAQLALDWLECDDNPRLFVTPDLNILWANRAAQKLFKTRIDFENRSGTLVVLTGDQQKKLRELVRGCGSNFTSLCLPADGGGHFIVRAQRLGGEGANVALILCSTGNRKVQVADCRTAFGLTPAENKVLMQLLDGNTAEAITAANGVSIDTVRSQIRHIYGKLDVASREGLFRRILPYILN